MSRLKVKDIFENITDGRPHIPINPYHPLSGLGQPLRLKLNRLGMAFKEFPPHGGLNISVGRLYLKSVKALCRKFR